MTTTVMPNYSISKNSYEDLKEVLEIYKVKKIVIIGGKRALESASDYIFNSLKNSDVKILGKFIYGKECTMENVNKLREKEEIKNCDLIFAVGGGKAIDTCKTLGLYEKKPVFSFPTISSNCSAATAIAVVYNNDGSMSHYEQTPAPLHMFINTKILVDAPYKYLHAGIGDGLSKQPEVLYVTENKDLDHSASLGRAIASSCQKVFLKYGLDALNDCKNKNYDSDAILEIALSIFVSTGYVSNLTNKENYYYNSSIAHLFYNASNVIKRDKEYLHGDVVAFGVLVLHEFFNNDEEFDRILNFNKSVSLPTSLKDVGIKEDDLKQMADVAVGMNEWNNCPVEISKQKFINSIKRADEKGKSLNK
ncbi:MAG: iron-containing alcohol dehydrogenase family protein [Peptoniphilaceae bacterium]|nr:iron-containing alcohol dehydrogenase family protein [Peptoniphilaceae bacterium]MDY3738329.1 iron-containing alcohol dehydrogenase family protein [Peptoniphilaceae bacterium]